MITENPRQPTIIGHRSIHPDVDRGLYQARQRAKMLKSLAETVQVTTHASPNRHWLQLVDPELSSRAAHNIAVWRQYLPADCVAAMIADGWHWST